MRERHKFILTLVYLPVEPDVCTDVESVFHYLEQPYRAHKFRHLMVALGKHAPENK